MIAVLSRPRRGVVLWWIWLKHVYPTHWAHKPLCHRFSQGVVRIGHVHLCRSCLFVYAGVASGIGLWTVNPPWLASHGMAIFATLAVTTIGLSRPTWYRCWPRAVRDLLRFGLGLAIPSAGFLLLRGHALVGLVGILGMFAAWRVYLRMRSSRRAELCAGCPELTGRGICSGFTRQAARLRAYEEEATRWIVAHEAPYRSNVP